jgi:hypothetical protein
MSSPFLRELRAIVCTQLKAAINRSGCDKPAGAYPVPCPAQGSPEAAGAGIENDPGTSASPGTPYGRANYCVNTAAQFYRPDLTPSGHNILLSANTWDPQLSALRPGCICSSGTFIGDYFGVATARDASGGEFTYTTSVSTFNETGENPFFHQQQVVARVKTP